MPHNALRLGYPFCLAPGKQVGMLRGVDVAGRKGKPAVWCRGTFPILPGSCSSRDWVMETGFDLLTLEVRVGWEERWEKSANKTQ